MYLLSAISGYLSYGNETSSPILANLSPGNYSVAYPAGVLKSIGAWIVTIHVLLACPVLLTTFSSDMERIFKLDAEIETTRITYARYLLRTSTMIFVCVLAVNFVY
jgi:hypothetical protein